MIFLTGLARSETSILGNILGSAKNVEYGYETPMLKPPLISMESIEKEEWKNLFKSYRHKEL